MQRLAGKTAIVTGATAGIGEAITRRFLAEGAQLVTVARDRDRGEALARALGDRVQFVPGSVTEPAVAEAAVRVAGTIGGVDILVNNAGIDLTGNLLDVRAEDVRRVMETNFMGALECLIAVARDMRDRRGGAIINITSRLASVGVPGMAVYAASKGALLSLTRAAAVELAPIGIRVNAIAPGMTWTPLMREWVESQDDPEAVRRGVEELIPQGRAGTPEDVAAAAAFLAADEASHITGVSLPVDGGYTAA